MHNLSNMDRYFLKLSNLKYYFIYNILFYFIILFKFIIIKVILFEILVKKKKKKSVNLFGKNKKNKLYCSKMAAVYYEKKKVNSGLKKRLKFTLKINGYVVWKAIF